MTDNPTREPLATVDDAKAVSLAVLAAKGIDPEAARRLIRQANRLEQTLPTSHPDLYRQNGRAIVSSRRVAVAFLAFRKVIDDELDETQPAMHMNHPMHDGN